jgi:energy-coupling factor transporter ATP-binding protein EcfA2
MGVTDYAVTRSYEAVAAHQRAGRLPGIFLFPNIELRLNTGTVKGNFVNIHLLVCPDDPNHLVELRRFLSQLVFKAFDDKFVCTPEELIRLGRRADSKLVSDEAALRHGYSQFKVSMDNLMDARNQMGWAGDNILIAVAGNADGTSGVKDAADATLREEMEKGSHAIFASSLKQRDFWRGRGAATVEDLWARYDGPKPCVWGCDAHDISRVGRPDDDRYCWIKGEPTFDALRQACIDPERAYVGQAPPWAGAPSQVIDTLTIDNSPWAKTPEVKLNSGLVAIIGARGSGKTALADMIATGCDAYDQESASSFLLRAREYLTGAKVRLTWADGQVSTGHLDSPLNDAWDAYQRARYLSQQFVDDLCSPEGMPRLIDEIQRVIFESHPSHERDGASDFHELLQLRANHHRETRAHEEEGLANISDQIGVELDKFRQVAALTAQVGEKEKAIARYEQDRAKLLPKAKSTSSERLQELTAAAETVRSYIRQFANQQASVSSLKAEVRDVRQNRAPHTLRLLKQQHQNARLSDDDWQHFLLKFSGDVDSGVAKALKAAEGGLNSWKGARPTAPVSADGSFLQPGADPKTTPLAILECEIERLQKMVAADDDGAKRLAALAKRLVDERALLERLRADLEDCKGAKARAEKLVTDREQAYVRVFDAILAEETVLRDLYTPLMTRLQASGETLAKLAFKVMRAADVAAWARRGEDLFDLRGGPFKGSGSLEKEANAMLKDSWCVGDSQSIAQAMSAFRARHQDALLERAPYPRSDQANYRPWSRRFAQWLYSTDHISIEYGITYGDTDIKKLSPGTRGIVLLLLYLALDESDDRPLIIDQPEENLDPQSVNDELVPLFQRAKSRRQVVIVTHNANLVVNVDADQVIVAKVDPSSGAGLPSIAYSGGGLDEVPTRTAVCQILEGGETAFRERARRLRIALARQSPAKGGDSESAPPHGV